MDFKVLEGWQSSGRPVGKTSTNPGTCTPPWCQGMPPPQKKNKCLGCYLFPEVFVNILYPVLYGIETNIINKLRTKLQTHPSKHPVKIIQESSNTYMIYNTSSKNPPNILQHSSPKSSKHRRISHLNKSLIRKFKATDPACFSYAIL